MNEERKESFRWLREKRDGLLVSEIFSSIQGEGKNVGKPSLFIRLALCNLNCWFCDTKYAVDQKYFNDWKVYTVREMVDCILKHTTLPHVVWTGGEPTLQLDPICRVIRLVNLYSHPSKTWEIETNGTRPFTIEEMLHFDTITVSPKFQYLRKDILSRLKMYPKVVFKFVIWNEESCKQSLELVKELNIPRSRVYFMPEGTTTKRLVKISKWLIEVCKKEGINYSPRLQIFIYGNKRGV